MGFRSCVNRTALGVNIRTVWYWNLPLNVPYISAQSGKWFFRNEALEPKCYSLKPSSWGLLINQLLWYTAVYRLHKKWNKLINTSCIYSYVNSVVCGVNIRTIWYLNLSLNVPYISAQSGKWFFRNEALEHKCYTLKPSYWGLLINQLTAVIHCSIPSPQKMK